MLQCFFLCWVSGVAGVRCKGEHCANLLRQNVADCLAHGASAPVISDSVGTGHWFQMMSESRGRVAGV